MLVPLKISISSYVGMIKGRTSIRVFDRLKSSRPSLTGVTQILTLWTRIFTAIFRLFVPQDQILTILRRLRNEYIPIKNVDDSICPICYLFRAHK
ncbi:MAG: hypothetical protein GY702_24790 [Desulfobulbaceae bacterium]|nr:hypothetical protein [Desulfobulbaceae bacterium]